MEERMLGRRLQTDHSSPSWGRSGRGYVPKDFPKGQPANAIRRVTSGKGSLNQEVATRPIRRLAASVISRKSSGGRRSNRLRMEQRGVRLR